MCFQERINKNLIERQFAIWRVDPPWLPRTKKAQGTRLGGGKGSIQKYVTPVKASRIILEVGGHITEIEVVFTQMLSVLRIKRLCVMSKSRSERG